jgi:hypothetical protein
MKRSTAFWLHLAALVLPTVVSATAAPLEWHQERVAALARDLIQPIQALREDLRSRPPVPGKEQARAAVVDDVERLYASANELAQRLAKGAGRAETASLFREIQTLESQAKRHAREYPAPFDMHRYTDRIQSITTRLAPYYEEPPDPGDDAHR